MKRREFLRAGLGVIGGVCAPLAARAQGAPCPPPAIWVPGEAAISTKCEASSGSGLGALVSTLALKQWARLPVSWPGGAGAFWKMPDASESILAYAHNGHYDPVRRRMYFVGCGYGSAGFITYDEDTDTWTSRRLSQGIVHIWDHSAYDAKRGVLHFTHQLGMSAYQLNVDNGAVSDAPAPFEGDVDTFPFEYWPGTMDSIIAISRDGRVRRRSSGASSYSDFGKAAWSTGYHAMAAYDHRRDVMYFGGGNGNDRSFWRLDSSGSSSPLSSAPQSIYVSSSVGLCDPLTGNYVLRSTSDSASSMAEFDPAAGWRTVSTNPPSFLGGKRQSMGVALTGHASGRGIFVYAAASDSQAGDVQVWLYRHS